MHSQSSKWSRPDFASKKPPQRSKSSMNVSNQTNGSELLVPRSIQSPNAKNRGINRTAQRTSQWPELIAFRHHILPRSRSYSLFRVLAWHWNPRFGGQHAHTSHSLIHLWPRHLLSFALGVQTSKGFAHAHLYNSNILNRLYYPLIYDNLFKIS